MTIQFEEEDEVKALTDGHKKATGALRALFKSSRAQRLAESFSFAGPKFGAAKKAYLCVGPSQICLLASSMSRRVKHFNGQIDYAWMEKVVVDSSSRTKFLVVLNQAKALLKEGNDKETIRKSWKI